MACISGSGRANKQAMMKNLNFSCLQALTWGIDHAGENQVALALPYKSCDVV